MSAPEMIAAINELEELGAIIRIEDDEHLLEALVEIGIEDN